MSDFPYEKLRRAPDVEAENLLAYDATDRMLAERALTRVAAQGLSGADIAVIGDGYGAITLRLAASGLDGVRVHQDLVTGRRALQNNARALGVTGFAPCELDESLLRGVRLVLLQLPKALAELEEIADAVARWAAPDVMLVAGGRVKHMTLAQNEVLGRSFAGVQAERAAQKSRLVVASEPRAVLEERPFPVRARVALPVAEPSVEVAEPSVEVAEPVEASDGAPVPSTGSGTDADATLVLCAHGGAFAWSRLDIGTRVLLETLQQLRNNPSERSGPTQDSAPEQRTSGVVAGDARVVVDLGCGTGALAAAWALAHPDARVIATDRSAAAVASARATMAANGLGDRVTVTHDDAGSELPDAGADVVLLNPPFHLGTSIHAGAATRLFEAAARLLRPGGELWTVYNSSLAYRSQLSAMVGPTKQVNRTPKFTVTRSIRR